LIGSLERDPADLVCISVVEPSKALHARNLCQRLRRALPEQRLVVGLWGRADEISEEVQLLRDAGVDEVFTTIPDLVAYVDRLASNLTEQTEPPARPGDEEERLLSLTRLGLATGEREPVLDRVTGKVARVFDVPVAAITLIDRDRQWFKAHTGLPEELAAEGTMLRDLSICAHVVAANGPVLVKDLKRDRRFGKSELLLKHGIRFYAGVPIHAPDGQPVGALCVMDLTPRVFTKRDLRMLEEKAADVTEELGRMADVTPVP
jgi:GAF domain-containing protein